MARSPHDRVRCRWFAIAVALTVLATARPAHAVAFCVVHPLNPVCCPTPCPVYDPAKVAKYLDEAQEAWNDVQQCQALALNYLTLLNSFGPNGPLATELRRLPGNVSGVFTTFKAALPGMLKPGDLANPRAVAEMLKASLFSAPGASGSASDNASGASKRADAASSEAFNALATGLHGYARLGDVAADRGKQTVAASHATDSRSDVAVNVSARQALADNLNGLAELMSSWAAAEATRSAQTNSTALGPLPAASNGGAAAGSTASPATTGTGSQLDALRQARTALNQMDDTVSALISLHNDRHAANILVAQFPALQTTVQSYDLATRFREAEGANAAGLLGRAFADGPGAFAAVAAQLTALDQTNWTDNATKVDAAAAAARSVVERIQSDPSPLGALRDPQWNVDAQGNYDDALPSALRDSFAAWLEDDKLQRFWSPLRARADQTIAQVQQRLDEISQRRGFDVTSPAAATAEAQLLAAFSGQVDHLGRLDTSSFNRSQAATVQGFAQALQAAVANTRADAGATNFVAVEWPQ